MMTALALALALQTTPGAQVMGPGWVGQHVDATGPVIAVSDRCVEIAVERQGIFGAGGRVWACVRPHDPLPSMGSMLRVSGKVTDTRMTRMGPRWMVVPVVSL
ncbi:MAG: hypothetical protein RSP_04980 [Rhodanobacter sp.]